MMELRWLLIIIGIVVVIAVYAYSRYQHHAKNEEEFSRTPPPDDPLASEEKSEARDVSSLRVKVSESKDNDSPLPEMSTAMSDKTESPWLDTPLKQSSEDKPALDEPTLIILHVWAYSGHHWEGEKLMEVAIKAGLTPTDRNIFEYIHQNNSMSPLFYVADKHEPGTFEWNQMEQSKIGGVSLFMKLPVFCTAHEAFLLMHSCAQRFSNLLKGEILDQSYKPLTQNVIDGIYQLCKDMDDQSR